ncbi:MAG TPA: ABC transporter substrate-binding protein [Acidiferrobacterales bacterium]|nr:ABC transporter substrate-binding protein [Acidiferrobacterales bacterium]
MKKIADIFSLTLSILLLVTFSAIALADTLDDVKQKGVLVAGVKDSLPPFGYVDPATRQIVGYDVDFCGTIAKRLGVKLELKPVTSASRIPQLMEGNVDIICATMTKTPERAKQIDFSYTYFLTGQKFLTKKGAVKSLKDMEGKKLGTAKGSTSEQNAKQAIPSATILSFDDYPQAFLALQQGKVIAVTTDESILAGMLGKAPNKEQFEIPNLRISNEPYGLGVRQGNLNFLNFVNQTLLDLEKSGEARLIFDKWFGPGATTPLKRSFKITAGK